jgi:DNA N-6-adenine-methyltransferase (Dam)
MTGEQDIGGHQLPYQGRTDEWLTPPEIVQSLGSFDLDPSSPIIRPWPTASEHLTTEDNGLLRRWEGRVWLNPPYGPDTGKWLARLAEHGDGIALIFARTETEMFHRYGWEKADAMLFLRGRLHFHYVDGSRAKANAGAPSVLIAYGARNVDALRRSGIEGHIVALDRRATDLRREL